MYWRAEEAFQDQARITKMTTSPTSSCSFKANTISSREAVRLPNLRTNSGKQLPLEDRILYDFIALYIR